jgi:hypothetical protein
MAIIEDLYVDQGSDYIVELLIQLDDGTIVNLTGFEVKSQFRKNWSSTIAYEFDCAIIGNPEDGLVSLSIAADTTTAIKPGRYWYDVEIYDPFNNIKVRTIEGIVNISPEITRI